MHLGKTVIFCHEGILNEIINIANIKANNLRKVLSNFKFEFKGP